MRASILLAAAAIAGTAALSGSASAQMGVYVAPGDYYFETPAPRAYGNNYYYDSDPAYVARRPYGRGGCGVYYFWNGERCVDARRR